MFYQTTVSSVVRSTSSAMCTYPGSDFAVITFEYDSDLGLAHAADSVKGSIVNVECALQVAEAGAAFDTEAQSTALALTGAASVNGKAFHVVEHFGVELVKNPTTVAETAAVATCTFTYRPFGQADNTKDKPYACSQPFSFSDCDKPRVVALDGVCAAGSCTDGPAPFEACDGAVFSSELSSVAGAVKTVTKLKASAGTCCSTCVTGVTLACTPILGLPEAYASQGIKRCEPTAASPALLASEQASDADQASPSMLEAELGVVLAVAGVTALVALVTVRHRRTTKAKGVEIDDCYHPLMD